jgi:thioredoxin-like negative regulator of GroEL
MGGMVSGGDLVDQCFSLDWGVGDFDILVNYLQLAEFRTQRPVREEGLWHLLKRLRAEMLRDPSRPRVRLLLAQALVYCGQQDEAMSHCRKLVLSRFSECAPAQQLLDDIFDGRRSCSA